MMQAELKDFRAVLMALVDGVEFSERLARHTQLCVAAGCLQLPFKLHASFFSTSLAKGVGALPQSRESLLGIGTEMVKAEAFPARSASG
jgi:hypothetical protein